MRKAITVALLLIVPLLLLGLPGVSQAQLVLYDDFSDEVLNPAKWAGFEGNIGPLSPDTEAMRTISGGQLELDHTMYGKTDSDAGSVGNGFSSVDVTNPAAVTAIQVDLTVESVRAVACSFNASPTRARTGTNGSFFNDLVSPPAGNQTGDIRAGIQKVRDTNLGDRIELFIQRCTNAGCTTTTNLTFETFTAGWTTGVVDTVRYQWDQPNHQFIFTLNPGTLNSETKIRTYAGHTDTHVPVNKFKSLYVSNSVASCLSGPRTIAKTQGLFDNVMVNP